MRDEAEKRIGNLYPKIEITEEMAQERPDLKPYIGQKFTVIAWLWARTVKSPNPAFSNIDVPLASTFMLSTKVGKEAYIEPVIENGGYRFKVKIGKPKDVEVAKNGTKLIRGANFRCIMSDTPLKPDYIKSEGMAGRMSVRMMAIVAEGDRGRVYLSPTSEMEAIACQAQPTWEPNVEIPPDRRSMFTPLYGLTHFNHLFTPRQLVALTTFSDLVQEARDRIKYDATASGMLDDGYGLNNEGNGVQAYADSVTVYLAFALSKQADLGNSLCVWEPIAQCPRHLFTRQAIPMVWDFSEGNPLGNNSGAWVVFIDGIYKAFLKAFEETQPLSRGTALQADASTQEISTTKIVSTDPPYYDNIGYADLSDFFYIWLRRSLRSTFPELFATLAVPKAEELVAAPYRHGDKEKAEAFFMDGMTQAMHHLAEKTHPAFPITIYYAFKQSDTGKEGTSSIGWETFLDAVIKAGFVICGTWPIRTENGSRMLGQGTNALASSIVLVCRKRDLDAPTVSRRDFLREMKQALLEAFDDMTGGAIAPVDFAQAIIGPGMGVFSKYSAVLEANGNPMSVHDAIILINRTHDEYFSSVADDFDSDTRFCISWFEDHGWGTGKFGDADVLARARGTSVDGVREAGVLEASRGNVRLLKPSEYPADWSPEKDNRIPVWEALHNLIRTHQAGGNEAAGELLARILGNWTTVRQLAYRLYTLCERKGWAEDARTYNELIISCHEIEDISNETVSTGDYQYSPQTKLDSFGR
jgi:putative DNA methylase